MSSSDLFFQNLPVRQINGCRYFGPKDEVKAYNPPKGSEIFVARIPQDFNHQDLLRIFISAGTVYDVRLMLTFMKQNKGYAFVRYFNQEAASNAIKYINGFRLANGGRKGHLVAMLSTDHRTLMLTGCAPNVTRDEVECVFRDIDGVELDIVSEEFLKGRTSPVFYLLFASHRSAALMKKKNWKELIPKGWGTWVELNWQPNNEVSQRQRFKLEKKKYLSFMVSCTSANLNGFQNPPANLGFPRSVLTNTNAEARPLDKALLSDPGSPNWNTFAYNNNEEQRSQESFLVNPTHYLLPKRDFDTTQGIASYPPLNQLSDNIQPYWSHETTPQNQGSSCFEPEGAWGGTPLLGLPQPSSSGNFKSPWSCGDSPSGHQNFSFEPENALGISSPLMQSNEQMSDENSQPQLLDRMTFLFGRPIRGRGINDQSPKTMRF